MICLAQCLGSFILGAIVASIVTSLVLAARQDLGGKNRPGAERLWSASDPTKVPVTPLGDHIDSRYRRHQSQRVVA
jgi:hypothetical protein